MLSVFTATNIVMISLGALPLSARLKVGIYVSLILFFLKRVERIELSSLAWKAKVLPLNYTRCNVIPL